MAGGPTGAQLVIATRQGIPQVPHARGSDRQRPAASTPPGRLSRIQAQIKLALPGRQALTRRGFQHLQPGFVVSRSDVPDIPRPRRDECTMCTAVAPIAVFTVRRYGDTKNTP